MSNRPAALAPRKRAARRPPLAYDWRLTGPMRDLDALAGAGKHHRVVTDDVAAADRREPDRARTALAGMAFARVHGELRERAAEGGGDDLSHLQRRARRRIDLVAMVRLDDLDVVAVAEHASGEFDQLEGCVDADAHVGREHDRDALRSGLDRALARGVEARRADHHLHTLCDAGFEVAQRRLGPG